ncbi:MAG: type I-B CRISPR-associated protein Cas8b1/Cst1 [bacterium]|nr:type I-B CRISPR-associated protein Cas8b1/Cst1 [bacterium]
MNDTNTGLIKIEVKDWLFNAGLTGLYRILKKAEIAVALKENYIEFDASALENFEDLFFDYFFETYEKDSLWYALTNSCKSDLNIEDSPEPDEEKINAFAKAFSSRINQPSYLTAYEIITGDKGYLKEKLKLLNNKKSPAVERLEKIKEIYDFYMQHKRIIQAKYVSYAVINNYWTGVSFLNKKQVKLNMFALYKKDFVEPVTAFLETEMKKSPYGNCITCNRLINKKSDGFEGLSWLKMDIDSNRKTSVYWNHKPDIIVCPICNLVYSCIPAGFVTHRKKGLFINDNSSSKRLIQINNVAEEKLKDIESLESLENFTYSNIINIVRQRRNENLDKEVENIQVVKYDSEKGYSFNLLSKHMIAVLNSSERELNILAARKGTSLDTKNYINLYAEVIYRLYRNMDLYPLVYLMLAIALSKKWKNSLATLLFKINMNFIGGGMSDKKIYAMTNLGLELKKAYRNRKEENKINGIAYRLLNSLKTRNTNRFMDVVINCHMHTRKEVPTLFVDCIDNMERFQAYGYAFLLGFTGEKYEAKKKKEADGNTTKQLTEDLK